MRAPTRSTMLLRSSAAAALTAGMAGSPASAQLPVSGVPVPELSEFDDFMQDYMSLYDISAGVLAVSRNGCIVYQRGFGYLAGSVITLPENTPMRIASVEKPIAAAAIRRLIDDGDLDWDEFLFDLGQPEGGVLPYTPWDGLGDSRLADVTIEHAFNHRGGWDRDTAPIGDPQFSALDIADDMGVTSPPGRINTIRYMLSQPLEFSPGTNGCTSSGGNPTFCYSNFGYMCLGRAIELRGGMSFIDFIRSRILTPDMWVPSTEIFTGRTFSAQQSPREPYYSGSDTCLAVCEAGLFYVECPYGGWEQELFIGHGNLVVSAAPLLVYMDQYQVGVGGSSGTPLDDGGASASAHTGGLDGTATVMWQRDDGVNIVVLFNKREGEDNYASELAGEIDSLIDFGVDWPTECVDGFWVDQSFPPPAPEFGGYNHPFRSMTSVVNNTTAGTKLRLKPGVGQTWAGTIDHKMRIDAPLGTARIGG